MASVTETTGGSAATGEGTGEAYSIPESKSTILDVGSGSASGGSSKEVLTESQLGTTRLSSVEAARRKRLIYFGMLAAATLAVTALIIALSGGSRTQGAVGATGLDETENPWPTAEERHLTNEEDNYIYAKTLPNANDANEPETDADVNPTSKRSPTKARKKHRKAAERHGTVTTTAATKPPDMPDDSPDESSGKGGATACWT
ncbi:hypothetical protein MTO96_008873 [Rhipicephalus appendiculatus]